MADPVEIWGEERLQGLPQGTIVYGAEYLGIAEMLWSEGAPAIKLPMQREGRAARDRLITILRGHHLVIPTDGDSQRGYLDRLAQQLRASCASVRITPACPSLPGDDGGPVSELGLFIKVKGAPELIRWALEMAPVELPHRNGKTPAQPLKGSYTLFELQTMEIPEPQWVVPGILPEGLYILAGRPKTGKSWLSLALALSVSSDKGKFLGREVVGAGAVLYFALEDYRGRVRNRVRQLTDGDGDWTKGFTVYHEPKSGPEGVREIDEWCRQQAGKGERIRLIVVDTLERMRRAPKSGASVYHEDLEALAPLQALSQKWHCVVLVLDHQRKALAEDIIDSVSGSAAKPGTADGIWILERLRGQHLAKLTVTGRDIEEVELELTFDQTRGLWSPSDQTDHEQRLPAVERRILLAMPRGVPTMSAAIALKVGLTADSLRKFLLRLERDGYITRFSQRQWLYGEPEAPDPAEQLEIPTPTADRADKTDKAYKTDRADPAPAPAAYPPYPPDPPTPTDPSKSVQLEACPECGAAWKYPGSKVCAQLCGYTGDPVMVPLEPES